MPARPHQSNFFISAGLGLSKSISVQAAIATRMPGHDVDQEQPVPGEGMADIAADGRADGRRQRGDQADHRRDDGALRRREDREGGGEDARDHAAADEALDRAVDDHLVDVGGGRAQRAGRGEAGRGDGEQHARRQQPRQEARQRDHDDFGDQIGGLHPGDLVGAGAQAGLDLGQRGRDDLDVEDRHEHAEHHRQEGDDAAQFHAVGSAGRRGRCADRVAVAVAMTALPKRASVRCATGAVRLSTSTTTDRPARSLPRFSTSAGTSMRTGTRCTTLVKLPVAFSGGSSENTAPEAGASDDTVPSNSSSVDGVDRRLAPSRRAPAWQAASP